MDKQTYKEKLLDPRWQKKRLGIFERDGFKCQICGETERTLHVHHKIYKANIDPWEYEDGLLITLCCDCHEPEQDSMKDAMETSIRLLKSIFLSEGIDRLNSILIDIMFQVNLYNRKPKNILIALTNLLDGDAGFDYLENNFLTKREINAQG